MYLCMHVLWWCCDSELVYFAMHLSCTCQKLGKTCVKCKPMQSICMYILCMIVYYACFIEWVVCDSAKNTINIFLTMLDDA